jgi:hypothetical protein
MNTAMIVVLSAFLFAVSLVAGDVSTGVVRATITSKGQAAESRIAYAFYPRVGGSMPAYQRAINVATSVLVPFRASDEDAPPSSSVLSESFFRDVLQDFNTRYQQYIASADDINEAPWVLIDSTMIYDSVTILGRLTDLAQVVRSRYEFTGGAHGNSFMTIALFSRTSGKTLTFEKDIIIDQAGFEKVSEAAFRKARKIPGKRSFKKAGYWFDQGFGLSQNVLLSNDTITLIYNPYECAPYVMGEIRIPIPLKEIAKYIRIPAATP